MRNWTWLVVASAVLTLSSSFAVEAPNKSKGIFSALKVGQPVTLKDHGTAYSISFMDDGTPLTHTVIEVGGDYFVVQDLAGVTDSVVPFYSLKGIVRVRTKLK
ncbi:MAG TPA: hypothetical protein VGP76_17400 [Planctomycetaceae bacterium]|jgi:hypothetical protein|nr:hypothetical protein [Planctomycetaceae bacterium]